MKKRISISKEYLYFWEYNGEPTMLLGGSVEDNLFQIDNLEEHLKLLHSVGGNYVRCTMSSRDPGDVWPHEMQGSGLYDLDKPSKEYWDRFDRFLELTYGLDIIVQIEVWDRFDFARKPWQLNPFNPKNNSNYTAEQSLLKEDIQTHPSENESRFFFTIPEEDNNEMVLSFQKAFVDRLLESSLRYPHVLYCMDNETCAVEGWGRYWSEYIKDKAAKRNIQVQTTEMWDAWNLLDSQHRRTFDHPELYSFCDVSQNNHNCGEEHWAGLKAVHEIIRTQPRPLNNVKIYGAENSSFGTQKDAIERFWRNVFGKMASARFHRPPTGLGLSDISQVHLKSMRMLLSKINIFKCNPNNELLSDRQENVAYCMSNLPEEIAVFFTESGEVNLDISKMSKKIMVRWLDVQGSRCLEPEYIDNSDMIRLKAQSSGIQAVIIKST